MRWPLVALCLGLLGCGRPGPGPAPSRLIVAYPSGPSSLVSYASNDEFTASVLRNAYEPLVDIASDLSFKPCLAESWHSPDERTWVFRLRAGVRLHDGRTLTATHVVEFIERANRDPASLRGTGNALRSIEATDERTMVMRTQRHYDLIPQRLVFMLIQVPSSRPEAPPLGTGPYVVSSWSPHGDAVLEAFDSYRDGAPAIRRLEFQVVTDARERTQRVRRGEAHLTIDLPTDELADLEATPSVSLATQQGLRVVFLGLNCRAEQLAHAGPGPNPLRDPRVRQAIALAIDRERLVQGPLGGQADVVEELVPPEVYGHHGGLEPRGYDPAAARRLLAEAGLGHGFQVTLDYIPGRYRANDGVVKRLSADLGGVGIEIRPRANDRRSFGERVSSTTGSAMYLLGLLTATSDAATAFEALVHTRQPGYGLYSGYSDPEVDRLLAEAAGPLSQGDRKLVLKAVAARIHSQLPVIPLYRQRDLYAFDARLAFQPRLDRRIYGSEIRWREPEPAS